ncbi:MAG: chorismate synthase [Lachnospiraceae bacterium]|nr:chorismate synthase [Lachnospiraceae bacterium]
MGSSYGKHLRLTLFGQSHAPAVGMTLEGVPAGFTLDMDALAAFLERRAPGRNAYSTARREADRPVFLSGLVGHVTCGTPLTAVIYNTDTRSADYENLRYVPRPGHADYTAAVKYGGAQDIAGGGHFSGRMTAPLCIAGGIAKQLLEKEGIRVFARVLAVGGIRDEGTLDAPVDGKPFPVVSDAQGEKMTARIAEAAQEGDSVGGIVECVVTGLPAGLGDPMFDGMENRIASAVFGIPAVKGIEFGSGFEAAGMKGSEHNDPFAVRNGQVVTETNHAGGILGGITDGMPLLFRAAFKPTPSIAKAQRSVDLRTLEAVPLEVRGRHDPCIVPRAVPAVEAAAAIAVLDAWLDDRPGLSARS